MRRAESESEDRASRKPLDQTSPHGLRALGRAGSVSSRPFWMYRHSVVSDSL